MKIASDLSALIRPISSVRHDPKNTRTHGEKNLTAIVASLREFGQQKPIVATSDGVVIAGNGTLTAALKLGATHIAVTTFDGGLAKAARAFGVADNRSAELAGWDMDELKETIEFVNDEHPIVCESFDFSFVNEHVRTKTSTTEDQIPDAPREPITRIGDVWILGSHRLMCGDSLEPSHVARLIGEEKGVTIHADPPYGMGKEGDGVENDNLYREKLDTFQMSWWKLWRLYATSNASVYIWGVATDLWRLWYRWEGLEASETLTFRNEIVWNKGSAAQGISQAGRLMYATATERCLFFVRGALFLGSGTKDDFFEGFEPIRAYIAEQLEILGWGPEDVKRICGVSMFGHWATRSQWTMIPRNHYEALQSAARDVPRTPEEAPAFDRPYGDLKRIHKAERGDLKKRHAFYETRAYFDNVHDAMTDVWTFPSVQGEERHGHATPKPVGLIVRAIVSSTPPDGLVLEPFLGSGTTLIACEQTGRRCYGMELTPAYCDTIVARWEKLTGKKATREARR